MLLPGVEPVVEGVGSLVPSDAGGQGCREVTDLVGQPQLGVNHILELVAGIFQLAAVLGGPVTLLLEEVVHVSR